MKISELIITPAIEQKLIEKHYVQAYELEEVFQSNLYIRFTEKGNVRGEDLYLAMGRTEEVKIPERFLYQ